jgi:midasin
MQTLVQRLATATKREIVVQNLSLQTDSTDLLGGYRPLEIRHLARRVYVEFVDAFVSSFSKSQNAEFLTYVSSAYEKGQWKLLSQCFRRAAKMGQNKVCELAAIGGSSSDRVSGLSTASMWVNFRVAAERFEKQRVASESGLAFVFTEGALVDAIRTGKWVLLDEINLASGETLERLCGLLDDSRGSLTLTERGDTEALRRHPDFRLFAAMNPATDTGKKDLPASIRARFTEIYVDELVDRIELRTVAARYLSGALTNINTPLEHSDTVIDAVDVYLQCRVLSNEDLVDGGGQKPRYTLRTLCRALTAGRNFILEQRLSPKRAILEGFELAFEGPLDPPSRSLLRKTLHGKLAKDLTKKELDHPGTRPGGRKSDEGDYVLMKPFWLKAGMVDCVDWADKSHKRGRSKFVLTSSARLHLRHLARAVAAGPWPVLLEGPTSAGKTTLVEYLAGRCGHTCVRINNHEHTDVQEYTGCYATDPNGKLVFQEGILVQALRKGHWVILDELNLAPSEVLEALNRLLDDNRELYLPEINETVSPHPNFRLFATQNPSGVYGGRKPLSRAFRNRFVEIHVSDIPSNEMALILELRCGCPPTHAKLLVKVMSALRQRRSQSGVFRGKDGLITPRDLLRWAERGGSSKTAIAMEGYMLLAERLRTDEEKHIVRSVIEDQLKVTIDCESLYFDTQSKASQQLRQIANSSKGMHEGLSLQSIAPTRSMLRLLTLVDRCVQQKEPVLLVGGEIGHRGSFIFFLTVGLL